MKNKSIPRIIIGGTNSGCGKTTVTCAVLSAILQKNMELSSFKCGPDYIDPMFHGKILSVPSSNLDPFFFSENTLKSVLAEHSHGLAVIEGVMGLFDGMSLGSTKGSTYDVAKITNSPVILTINCKGAAYSVLPIIEGFINHKNDYNLAGVILNNMTSHTFEAVKKLVEENLGNKVKMLGHLPKLPEDLVIESRHLGLVTANEIENIKEKLAKLGEFASKTIDIEKIIEIANTALKIEYEEIKTKAVCKNLNIAVAMDNAFCFYYKDNLALLEKLGATLKFFSPIKDKELPKNTNGIYLGGGYPELYLKELSENVSMKNSILKALNKRIPCIAECGGFMYLTEKIDDYEMLGFIKTKAQNTKKLSRFGYIEVFANEDNLLCKKGESFKGHEFHYFDALANGTSFTAHKPSGKTWQAAYAKENLYAGFPHISFLSNPKIAENFINKCMENV